MKYAFTQITPPLTVTITRVSTGKSVYVKGSAAEELILKMRNSCGNVDEMDELGKEYFIRVFGSWNKDAYD